MQEFFEDWVMSDVLSLEYPVAEINLTHAKYKPLHLKVQNMSFSLAMKTQSCKSFCWQSVTYLR